MKSDTSADIILHNARVITIDHASPTADIVAIKGNTILAVGSKLELDLFKGASTQLLDCEQRTIVPGFNDAHCHPISFAMTLLYLNCSPPEILGIADLQAKIRQQVENTPESKWIRAAQYNESYLVEKRHPTRWDLDKAAPHNPVILVHSSGNFCVLNSLALQMVGITYDTPEPRDGHIGRDELTGEPNGVISGRNELVEKGIPPPDVEEIRQGIKLASEVFISNGITSVQDTTWSNAIRHWELFQRLKGANRFTPRVTMLVGSDAVEDFQANGLRTGNGDSQLRVGGVKIALDESMGQIHPSQEELNHHALRAHRAGFQLAMHVSDVYDLEAALSSLDYVAHMDFRVCERPRLEHCALCPPGLVQKLRAAQPVVVTQPSFLYYLGDNYTKGSNSEQLKWLYPLKSMKSQEVTIAAGSDSPLVPCNPLTGICAAVTRKGQSGQPISPDEHISPLEALEMYTVWPAFASFEEELKGTISPGKLADLVVLSDDPTQVESGAIKDLKPILTMMDGKVVWEK